MSNVGNAISTKYMRENALGLIIIIKKFIRVGGWDYVLN